MTDQDYEQIREHLKDILLIADNDFPEKDQIFDLMEKIRERQMRLFYPDYEVFKKQTGCIINKILF